MREIPDVAAFVQTHPMRKLNRIPHKDLIETKMNQAFRDPELLISSPDRVLDDLPKSEALAVVVGLFIKEAWDKKLKDLDNS